MSLTRDCVYEAADPDWMVKAPFGVRQTEVVVINTFSISGFCQLQIRCIICEGSIELLALRSGLSVTVSIEHRFNRITVGCCQAPRCVQSTGIINARGTTWE